MGLVAVAVSPLWSVGIAVAVGTTGTNMASSCGKLMIMAFAAWYHDPTKVVQVLALGSLSIAIIDQAMDLVRDFKTAHLLGASPRSMLIAQLFGATLSCIVSAAAYSLLTDQSGLPSEDLPCVVAKSYRALAYIFSAGFGALPKNCLTFMISFGGATLLNNLAQDLVGKSAAAYFPSAAAVGIGMYLLPGQILAVALGMCIKMFWLRVNPVGAKAKSTLVGAGMLAGDGLGGIVVNIFSIAGLQHPVTVSFA